MFDTQPSAPSAPPAQPSASFSAPQPQLQPAEPAAPIAPVAPRRKSRLGAILAIVILLIVLLVGAAVAYYFLVFSRDPEYVVGKSMLAMSELQSAAFDVQIGVSGEIRDGKHSFSLTGATTEELGDVTTPILVTFGMMGAAEFSEDGDFVSMVNLNVVAGEEDVDVVAVETRRVNEAFYLKLPSFTLPELIPGLDVSSIVNVITNRWIEIDTQEIIETIGAGEFIKKIEDKQAEQEEKYADRLEELFKEYLPTFVTVTETLESEEIHGMDTHHFAYVVNEDALRGFSSRVQEIVSEEMGEAVDKQLEQVDEFLDQIDDLHGEMWIGTSDSYLHKLTLAGRAVLPEGEEGDKPMQLSLTAILSQFNEPVVVEVPEPVSLIKEVFEDVMEAIMAKASEAKSDEDQDGLSFMEETEHGTDPNNADTDGDGFTDGAEVDGGYNPNGPGELSDN